MGGLGHDFKAGVNFINEPRLFITFNTGKGAIFNTHLTNDVNGPIPTVTVSDGDSVGQHPDQAVRHLHPGRLAAEQPPDGEPRPALGPRDRLSVRPVEEPELRRRRQRGEGRPAERHRRARELRAETPRTTRTTSSRASARRTTCAATARTSSAPAGASTRTSATRTRTCCSPPPTRPASGFGQVFSVDQPAGIRNPDGSFYRAGQPLSNIQSQNEVVRRCGSPLFGQYVDPRLEQPYTKQTNARLVARADAQHGASRSTTCSSIGGDLNFRPRVNQRIAAARRPPARRSRADAQPEHQRQPARRSAAATASTTR